MRLTRKTMVALGISGALTVVGAVSASAAVLGLPILGFGEPANEAAAPPEVVHRTVYDDHYVTATTAPRPETPTVSGGAARTGTPSTIGVPATTPPPVVALAVAAPPPTTPPAAEPPSTTPVTVPTTVGRPPVPAGCREPEWDAEHRAWHCSTEESDD